MLCGLRFNYSMNSQMRKTRIIASLIAWAIVTSFLRVEAEIPAGPNFVIIFVDDLGYGDPSSYGGELFQTPAIDRLAEEGVRATAGYVTSPNCSPSRHGIMSGAYQQRFGVESNRDSWQNMPGIRIPLEQVMLPQALRNAGYVAGHVGIWNIKSDVRIWFDEVYSPMDWGADFWPDEDGRYIGVWQRNPYERAGRDYGFGPVREGDEYLTDRLGREAVEFIENNAHHPFFLHFAPNAVHSPLQAKREHLDQVAHIESEPLRIYAAMVLSLDENIGRILDALDRTGVADNTFVVFASDNGPSGPYQESWPEHWEEDVLLGSLGKLSGRKGRFREGGIRVPYILKWPGVLPAGVDYHEPISTLDVYPTFAAAASYEIPEGTVIDGVNLIPYLTGAETGAPHEALFWSGQNRARGAVRMGDWKLLMDSAAAPPSLHNLRDDPAEAEDRSSEYPEIWSELYTAWVHFQYEMPDSYWDRYHATRDAYDAMLASGPRALHELDPDEDDDVDVQPSLENYEAFVANPPDGGSGPTLWFRDAREPNHGSAGTWTIGAASPLTEQREDFFGNPTGAFGMSQEYDRGAAISGSGGTDFAAGDQGALLITFQTSTDVMALSSIFSKGTFSDDLPFEVSIYEGFVRLSYREDAETKRTDRLLRIAPNSWYTLAVSWDVERSGDPMYWTIADMGQGLKILETVTVTKVGTVARPIRVAGRSSSDPFYGSLQNIVIYDRYLDENTINSMFSAIAP